MFFDGWPTLLRTLVVGVLGYTALVVVLRVSGKRTLAKLNAFDLVITVALGSTLAAVLLDRNVALAEGALAFVILAGLQFVVTWTSIRVRWLRRVVTGEPTLLLRRGEFVSAALLRQRITEDEVRAAVRAAGLEDLDEVSAVVLETDGSMSVIRSRDGAVIDSALADVQLPQG